MFAEVESTGRAKRTFGVLLSFRQISKPELVGLEKLEQLRALEHGSSIFVMPVERATHGIDTEQQYEEFVQRFKGTA